MCSAITSTHSPTSSYLATATQWESLRRLAALVDYHPAPPASAFTNLVLVAKPGASGTVPPGFAVSAATPGTQITSETMEELAIDSALNELRPQGFDRNPEVLTGNTLELDGQVDGLALGEPVVIESEIDGSAWARRVDNITVGATTTTVQVSPDLPAGVLVRGRVVVHAKPKDRLAALRPSTTSLVIGNEVVLVRGAGGIKIGDVLTIADQVHRSYHQVTGVFDPRVTFDRAVGELRFDSASVSPVVSVDAEGRSGGPVTTFTAAVAGDWRRLANQIVADPRAFTTTLPLRYTVSSADYTPTTPPPTVAADGGKTVLRLTPTIDGAFPTGTAAPPRLLVPAAGDSPWTIDRPFVVKASDEITTTLPRTTVGGDFVVAITDSSLAWGAVSSITRDEPARQASIAPVSPWQRTSGDLLLGATTVFGHFTGSFVSPAGTATPRRSAAATSRSICRQRRRASPSGASWWCTGPTPPIAATSPRCPRSPAARCACATAFPTGPPSRARTCGSPATSPWRATANVRPRRCSARATPRCRASASCSHSRRSRSSRIRSSRAACAPTSTSWLTGASGSRSERYAMWPRRLGERGEDYRDGTLELEFGDGQTGRRLPTGIQ